jgi:hypothetical protein
VDFVLTPRPHSTGAESTHDGIKVGLEEEAWSTGRHRLLTTLCTDLSPVGYLQNSGA